MRLICAVILLQTLYFKFGAAPESVYIFETMGLGAAGRIATGIAELVAIISLFFVATRFWGATLAFGIMLGAVLSHLTILGVSVLDDGGQLFLMALLVLLGSIYLMFQYYPGSLADKLGAELALKLKKNDS